jgi:PAS domain S-box-containing protein
MEIPTNSSKRSEMLFQYAPDAIFLIDDKGKLFDLNKAAEELIGQKKAKLIGKSGLALGLLTIAETKKAFINLSRILGGKSRRPDEYTLKKKDGSLATVEVTSFSIKIKNKKFLLGVSHNITGHKKIEEALRQQTHDLGERIKELNCLYQLDKISHREGVSIDRLLREVVRILPKSWQYPEIAGSCISFQGKEYKTKNFKKTDWKQKAEIIVDGKKAGFVEVCYLKRKPESDEGPFLKEERNLINAVSERLGQIIEQKQARKALESSEDRLRMIFEYAPDAYYLNDLKGNFVDGNKATEELTGYKREELIGKNLLKLKLLPPEYIPKAAAILAKNKTGKPTGPDEFYLAQPDGRRVPVEIRTFPVKIAGQMRVLGIAGDITERKKSEELYRELVEKAGIAILVDDREGNVIYANKKAAEIYGYSLEEMKRQSIQSLVHPDDREMVNGHHRDRILGKDAPASYEFRAVRKDGSDRYLEIVAVPNIIEGKIVGSRIYTKDVTEPRRASEALRKSEERFRRLFNRIFDPIVIIDKEKVVDVNEAACKLLGYSREELQKLYVGDIHPREEMGKITTAICRVQKSGTDFMGETVLLSREGRVIPVEAGGVTFELEGKTYVMASFRDITERKKAEEAIKKRKHQLELIHRIQNDIPMNMDIETILKSAAESIARSFRYNKVSVNLLDPKKNELEYKVGYHKSGTPPPMGHRQKIGEGLIGKAAELRKTIIANDVSKHPSYVVYYQSNTQSELSIPLFIEDQLVGILDIQDVKKNVFTEEDVSVLQSVANYLAYVINEKQTEEQLMTSLKEKEVLLREIHHRVKNNLQVICSLLSLQSHNIEGKKNIEMFRASQDRVKSMALIHEKLYQSQDLARINSREYIQALVSGLYRSYCASPGIVNLKLDVEDISLSVDNAIPCGLILNELVSNSLKHAFPDGKKGWIRVILRSANQNDIVLMVSDNGVGLPESLDIRKTKSLGLHLVTILAEDQLHGEIKLNRNNGTEFRIKLRGEK